MANDWASSIQGAAIRVSRLAADGSLASGANASYVMNSFISLKFTPVFEDGVDITQKAADGSVCVSFLTTSTLKRITIELDVCDPDPQVAEILSGGTLLADSGSPSTIVGWQAPLIGELATPNGVAIEVWSKAISNGRQAATNPYWHWVFPYMQLTLTGDRTIENGLLATTFSGYGTANDQFSAGTLKHTTDPWPFTTISPYQYARSSVYPTDARGYVPVTGS